MKKLKESPKTKEDLLNAAEELILAKGFSATSVDEICRAAKLTKGSFFHYFKSKEELGRVLLERFCCHSQQKIKDSCCGPKEKTDPLKRVYSYLDGVEAMCENTRGCLLGIFAQEMSDSHPKIRSLCAEGFNEWAKILKGDLAAAKARYASRASFDPGALAEHCIAIFEGAMVLARAKQDNKVVKRSLEHLRAYLKSLFGK